MITKQKGTHDLFDKEAKKWQYVNNLLADVCEKYNYSYIRTPIFEASELFHRGIGETTDIVSKETYDFKDRGDRNITLRPEGTAGVVRSYIENKMYGDALSPKKFYYNGTMYRYERPQSGRDRELTQFGIELIGSDDPYSDAEVIALATNIYRLIGLHGIKVNINSLGDQESRENYREALVKYFKPHLKDLCGDCQIRFKKNPLRMLDCKVDNQTDIMKNVPSMLDYLNDSSKERFEKVKSYLNVMGILYEVNDKVVRGLDYYNHTVFEIEADIPSFGTQNVLGGGGRYNNLVESLGGPSTPAVGFACGVGRLIMAIDAENIDLPIKEGVDIFVMSISDNEKLVAANLVENLRLQGFCVDTEYTNRGLKAQFKQADRLQAKLLLILNDKDINNNQIQVKNNVTKEEQLVDLDYLVYYLDEQLTNLEDECNCGNDCECNCGDDCHCHEE